MAFLWVALPSKLLIAGDIPDYGSPPPVVPTIRGDSCSSLKPNVLSPAFWKPISTTEAYPTFLFFVPTTSARQAQFVFKDSDRKTIYRRTYNLSGQSGILRVALPNDGSISKLTVGQTYKWEFDIICNPDDRVNDDFVVGTLQRIPLSRDAQYQLPQLSLRDRLELYWVNGFAYDALLILDALRRENPSDKGLQAVWEAWLERHYLGDLKKLPAIVLSPSQNR